MKSIPKEKEPNTYTRLPNKRTGKFINFEKFFKGYGPYLEGVCLSNLKIFTIYLDSKLFELQLKEF